MGKKKQNGEYNDFLDGEKLRDNGEIRTSLQHASISNDNPPQPARQDWKGGKKHGKGKEGAKKARLTHFLCLPLVTDASRPQFQTGLERLKGDLERDAVVPSKAVRPLGTLHLTLGVMSLDEIKLEETKQYLQALSLHRLLRDLTQRRVAEKAAEDGTISENLNAAAMPDTNALTIDLEALTPMQTPQKTSILYASPKDSTNRLLSFASSLRTEFTQKGFMVEDTRPLKLHATIINTIYAKPDGRRGRKKSVKDTLKHIEHKVSPHHHDSKRTGHDDNASTAGSGEDNEAINGYLPAKGDGHGPDAKSWMHFDARDLIDRYKGFTWAEDVRIDRVQICKMGAKKIWSGGTEGEGEVVDEKYEVVFEKNIFD
jgi:activating signal cointegrator complex subunit 1